MLFGEYSCVIDDKGRLNFPAKLRDEMGEKFIVTRGLDENLNAYPASQWEEISRRMAERGSVRGRSAERFVYASAAEVAPDKQGRILLPPQLRGHAKLAHNVVVVGVNTRVEIWDSEVWRETFEGLRTPELEQEMEEMGF